MLLFIIYIEPFLLYLEKNLVGLNVAGIPQVVEAFCDDVNIITDNVEDLVKIDDAVVKFEHMSGAIFLRNFKCKILGIGRWKDKKTWPISYIRSEKEIKVFEVFVQDSYQSMVKKNWEFRLRKFQNVTTSWASKFLPSLRARVEVLNVYALS